MTQKDQNTYDEVMKKWSKTNTALTATFKRYNDLEDLYFFHTPKNKNSSKSNIFDPMAYEQVEHTVSHLYSNEPRGAFTPVGFEDLQGVNLDVVLTVMNELIKQQWGKRDADMFRKVATTLRRAAMYGIGWGVQHWRYERIFHKPTNKFVTIWDDWCYYPLSNYDCWPDIDAQSGKEMEFFIHDEYITLDDIESQKNFKGEKRYTNIAELKKAVADGAQNTNTAENPYRNNLMVRRKIDNANIMEDRIKVRRCYYKDRWITLCPDYNLLIEDGPNLYHNNKLPVRWILDQDIPGVVLGLGDIDPVRTLMMATNQFINMRMDNIKMNMERPVQVRKGAFEFIKQYIWKKNQIWPVNQDGDVKLLDVQDVTGNTFIQTLNWLQDVIRTRSGRSDILTNNRGNKTATEIDAAAEEQNARLKYKLNNFEEFIKDLMVGGMELNQMFLKTERFLKIIGTDDVSALQLRFESDPERIKIINESLAFLKVGPEDILGQFDYLVESGSTLLSNITREIQNISTALQVGTNFEQVLQQNGKTFDPAPVLKKLVYKLGIKEDVIKDIKLPEANQYGQQDQGGLPPVTTAPTLSGTGALPQ